MKIAKYVTMIILCLAGAQSGRGTVLTWNGSVSTTFTTTNNWVGNVAPANSVATDTARFTGAIVRHPNITSSRSIKGLVFESAGWVLNGAGWTLSVGSEGIKVTNTSSTAYIAPNLLVSGNQSWFVDTGAQLSVTGTITTATSALTKSGGGSLNLYGALAFASSNTFNISAGAVRLYNNERIGDAVPIRGFGGASLFLNGYSETVGTLGVADTNGLTIDFGAASGANALAFAASSGVGWLGTLTILNFESGVDSLRFGTSSNAITTNQISRIQFGTGAGLPAQIDSQGFITAIPEPTTITLFTLTSAMMLIFRRIHG